MVAHPSKSGGDWWYGRNVSTGKRGLFPKTYVEVVKPCKSLHPFAYYKLLNLIQRKQRHCMIMRVGIRMSLGLVRVISYRLWTRRKENGGRRRRKDWCISFLRVIWRR